MAYAVGPISCCHINLALTLGAPLADKLPSRLGAGYLVAQVVGAIVAAQPTTSSPCGSWPGST
ncbi:MAG: aquaporin [Chloroflexi bacterium]|nr:aquaporin [Chloroflexota bacterium]